MDRAVAVSEAGVVLDLLADFRDPQEVVVDLTAETAHQEVAVAHEVVAVDTRIKDTIRVIIKVTTVVVSTYILSYYLIKVKVVLDFYYYIYMIK